MPGEVNPKGKTFIATENGESISVRHLASSKVQLPNGQTVQVERAFPASGIAASTTDGAFIPAPASDQFYIAVLSLKVMCDAATLVTLNTKGAGAGTKIDSPWPFGANGGSVDPMNAAVIARGLPGEAITITTGSGGTTYARAQYITVPIDVDIL